jgi:hypothetical protein
MMVYPPKNVSGGILAPATVAVKGRVVPLYLFGCGYAALGYTDVAFLRK